MVIMTPGQLWEGYNRFTPPSPTVIQQLNIDSLTGQAAGFVDKRVYFNGYMTAGTVVRVYSRLILPPSSIAPQPDTAKPPVLIVADAADKDIDNSELTRLTELGYALLLVDYTGNTGAKTHYTLYPRLIGAAWEEKPELLKEPPDDPAKSCWYYFTTCILHAVTFLEQCDEVDGSRIGIIGIGEGTPLVFKASFFPGIKAGMTFFNGDISGTLAGSQVAADPGSDYLAYKAALDSRAYAKNCFPVLINATTNEKSGALDYLNGLHLACPEARFCVFERADKAVSAAQRNNIKLWFDKHFSAGGKAQTADPELKLFCSEGQLYAEITGEFESAAFFAAEERPAALRNWTCVSHQRIGDKYLCRISAADPGFNLFIFATVTYSDGLTLSTPLYGHNPNKGGVRTEEKNKSRLLYQSEMNADTWAHENGDFFFDPKVEIKEGPFGLSGAAAGELITFKPGDARFRAGEDALMQLILFSPLAQEIEITVTVYDGAPYEYKCRRRISGTDWTTLTLSGEDFKSARGTAALHKAAAIAVKGQSLIINSLIWV